jgi:hypothetical protein
MNPTLARRLLGAALILGIAGNWLLRVNAPRAGLTIWLLGIIAVAFAASGSADTDARDRRVLLGAGAVLAIMLVLREAEMLYIFNMFALLVTAALIAWRAGGRSLATLEPRDAVAGGITAATNLVVGAPTLALRDAAPPAVGAEQRRSLGGLAIGAIAATPVLLIVAALLGEADPVFAEFLQRAANLLDVQIVGHILGSLFAAWVAAGLLRGSITPVQTPLSTVQLKLRATFVTLFPLLGGLALLLTLWIGLQVSAMFGGSTYLAMTSDITVAEYARRGFFELIVIAGIVLGALLVSDEVLERDDIKSRGSLRAIGFVLLVLVGAVLTSAMMRLSMYLRHFGLTEDRVMAFAVLIWVALMLAWFGWTVLRGARHRFAPGVLVISAIWLGGLNLSNPERWIVETNLRRAERGLEFDTAYHATLSVDARGALEKGVTRLSPELAAEARDVFNRAWAVQNASRQDWREASIPLLLAK